MHKHISVIPSKNSACTSFPPDAYPIIPINNTTFKVEPSTAIIPPSRNFCNDFADYIQSMPQLISKLISNFRTNLLSDSLAQFIQQKTPLYISTDTNKKSGGSWSISLVDGIVIVTGWNLNFGQITTINSYHSKIYESLASLTFLECYCDYFHL